MAIISTKIMAGTNQRVAGTNCSGISKGMAIATKRVRTTGSRGSPRVPSSAAPPEPSGAPRMGSAPAMPVY